MGKYVCILWICFSCNFEIMFRILFLYVCMCGLHNKLIDTNCLVVIDTTSIRQCPHGTYAMGIFFCTSKNLFYMLGNKVISVSTIGYIIMNNMVNYSFLTEKYIFHSTSDFKFDLSNQASGTMWLHVEPCTSVTGVAMVTGVANRFIIPVLCSTYSD